ncbi:MAG: hypothetical protein IKG93_06745 [Clostridiales bacterium]|nr:hypothetical protein [Clostridiales bacterium]
MKKCIISIALVLAFSTALTSCAKNSELEKTSELSSGTQTSETSSEITETTSISPSETESVSTTTTTTEETSTETTEPSETSSETSSAPDGGTPTKVKVNWDSYEKAEHSDPIVTRLREEPVEDFITSSDYGHVMPFCAAHGESEYMYDDEIAVRYGFIDAKGRLVCDGVFSDCYRTTGGYTVYKAVPSTSGETDKRVMGYLSSDGSFYTGTNYDSCFYRGDNLYLIKLTSSGVSYVSLDMTSRKMSEEKSLRLDDLLKDDDFYFYFEGARIVDDRYFVSVGEQGEVLCIFDGETGKEIDIPAVKEDYVYYPYLIGNTLLYSIYDWENESNSRAYLYSITGELLFESNEMIRISNQRILIPLKDKLVLIKDGKAQASIATDGIIPAANVRFVDDYILLTAKDGLKIYDMDCNLIRSIPEVKTEDYFLIYATNYLDADFKTNYFIRPDVVNSDSDNSDSVSFDGATFIINILTGEKTEIGSYPECSVIENTSYILVENGEQIMLGDFDYKFKYDFKIIDTKDGSIIYQSDRPASDIWTLSDIEGHSYMIITDYENDSRKIFDFSSGEFLFNGEDPFPSGVSYIAEVYNGSFRCTSKEQDTYLIDRDGKVVFMYYPLAFDD